ncbi:MULTISPECIES: hypothetical protein [unclassified Microbacterium]|nr:MULTISPECIES: hypothetical protein [unclassified Microbacterium]MCR2808912.1 hypothetical protein [Microbacterium sp. zg.B185]WIM18669.1 hypothetical protein QNO12_13900 [Microbacterium sp. zg-B185]
MNSRRRRGSRDITPRWWQREVGGMPVWGLVVTLAVLVIIAVFSLINVPR